MDSAERLERLADAIRAMTQALGAADPAAPVPTCPGWTVADLAGHLVMVHRWAGGAVRTGQAQSEGDPADLRDPIGAYPQAAAELVLELTTAAVDRPCWNFTGEDLTAGFWRRRQLHEVTVHTADVVLAAGGGPVVPMDVAVDGVDEVMTVWPRRLTQRGLPPEVRDVIGVSATDAAVQWEIGPGEPPVGRRVGREPTAEATVRGRARDLYLAMWGRLPLDRLEVRGDPARAWLAGPLTP